MSEVSAQLDPNALEGVVARLEDIVGTTLNLTSYKDDLLGSLNDLTVVLSDESNNPDRGEDDSAHHMFVFNAIISDLLMLPKFHSEISTTLDSTMEEIKGQSDHYLGIAREEMTSLSEGIASMHFEDTLESANETVDDYLRINGMIDDSKSARFWVMICLYVLFMLVAIPTAVYALYLFCCCGFDDSRHQQQQQHTSPSAFDDFRRGPRNVASRWPSPKPAMVCCCANLICCILALFVGGILLALAVVQIDTCQLANNRVLTEDGIDDFLLNVGVDSNKTRNAVKACLVESADNGLVKALELNDSFVQIPRIREFIGQIQDHLPMPFNVSFIDELIYAADDYGWIFLANQTEVKESGNGERLSTYPEVLHSGIQDKGRFVKGNLGIGLQMLLNIDQSDGLVYGLLDIEKRIAPFYFQALHSSGTAEDPTGNFMITADFDPDSSLVLSEARARTSSEEEYKWFTNAVWWASMKQKLRAPSAPFTCPQLSDVQLLSDDAISGRCTYAQFVPYVKEQLAGNVHTVTHRFALVVEEGKYNLVQFINSTANELLDKAQYIENNLNCGTTAKNVDELVDVWCDSVTHYTTLVAIVWVVLGVLMTISFVTTYLLWRVIDHNRKCDRLSQLAAESSYENNPEYYQYA
eukprot:GHVS01020679.1.p1 GENE.GHVS01020679.1~~GHVS01020679.1.p1  ORF type:complete len:741 (+),score=131.92 GHVS01020679.1:307-2223(+)